MEDDILNWRNLSESDPRRPDLDWSCQVLQLWVPEDEVRSVDEVRVQPRPRLRPGPMMPAGLLAVKAKAFSDGLMAAVELAADAGCGCLPGRRALLRAWHEASGSEYLAAALHLRGDLDRGHRWLAFLALLAAGCSAAEAPPKELYNKLLNVRSLAFSPDGRILVGGRNQGSEKSGDLLVWEGEAPMREVPAHDGDVVGVVFTETELVSAGANGELKHWKPDGTVSQTLTSQRWLSTLQPSGSAFAVLRAGGRTTFQPRQAEVQFWKDRLQGSFSTPGATLMAASASLIATAGPTVVLWKPDGTRQAEFSATATALDFSPDGKTLAVGGPDGSVQLIDGLTLAPALLKLPSRITGLRYAPDGRLAVGCEGHLVLIQDGTLLWDRTVQSYASPSVLAFSADSKRLATAGPSKVLLWSL